jgi:hypothetical protein
MRFLWGLALTVGIGFLAGCASPPKTYPGPGGIAYQEDKDLHKVWLATNFNFSAYDTIYITDTLAQVAPKADEAAVFEMAKKNVRDEFAAAIQERRIFRNVVTRQSDVAQGSRALVMTNYITEFRKGGGGARYFAGGYGAGQPIIKIHGILFDQGRPVFDFESRRSGDSAGSRMFGGFMKDEDIQLGDIRAMAKYLADFMSRTALGMRGAPR